MDHLPIEIRDGLRSARRDAEMKAAARMHAVAGGRRIKVLRSWPTGFSVEATTTGDLRGLIDLFDGARDVARCLIVTAREEGGECIYEYKRSTAPGFGPPVDFEQDPDRPEGFLPPPL